TAASRLRRAREAFADRLSRASSLRHASKGPRMDDAMLGLEIVSWWVSDGEVDALRAVLDIYRRSHPGASIVHGGIRGTTTAKTHLHARMSEGSPPDTFQANGG